MSTLIDGWFLSALDDSLIGCGDIVRMWRYDVRWEALLQMVAVHHNFDGIDDVGDADVDVGESNKLDVGDVDMKREQLLEKCNFEI